MHNNRVRCGGIWPRAGALFAALPRICDLVRVHGGLLLFVRRLRRLPTPRG